MPTDSDDSTDMTVIDSTRMGGRRRQAALIVTLIGLATFVTPLIETDSEVLGRMRWSPLQIIVALHAGTLPINRPMFPDPLAPAFDLLVGIGAVYFLLVLISAAIALFPSARFLGSASAIGAAVVLGNAQHRYFDLQEAIYGEPSAFTSGHQVHAGTNSLILLGVLGLLIFIAATKQLD